MTVVEDKIDTSGWVFYWPLIEDGEESYLVRWWGDLALLAQGYTEALLRDLNTYLDTHPGPRRTVGYRHLAPECLAMIVADCKRLADEFRIPNHPSCGRDIWESRSRGMMTSFHPVTSCLDDDDMVRLRPVEETMVAVVRAPPPPISMPLPREHRFGSPPEPVANPSAEWCEAYADWYHQGRG